MCRELFGTEAARRVEEEFRQVAEGRTLHAESAVNVWANVVEVGKPAVRVANVSDGHLRVPCVDGIVLIVALEPVEGRAEDFGEMYGEVVNGSLRSDREHVDAWYSRHEVGRLVMHHGEARRVLNVFPESLKCVRP